MCKWGWVPRYIYCRLNQEAPLPKCEETSFNNFTSFCQLLKFMLLYFCLIAIGLCNLTVPVNQPIAGLHLALVRGYRGFLYHKAISLSAKLIIKKEQLATQQIALVQLEQIMQPGRPFPHPRSAALCRGTRGDSGPDGICDPSSMFRVCSGVSYHWTCLEYLHMEVCLSGTPITSKHFN